MIRFVSYSAPNMTTSLWLACESAKKMGAETVWPNNDDCITPEFRENNREILAATRGHGYWLWKPYFINHAMNRCQDGDILIYGDAGCEFIAPFQHIIDVMDQDLFLFCNGHRHVEWCKMDVMNKILPDGGWVTSTDMNQMQAQASVIFIRVNQYTRNFIKEWLLWCQMPGMIDDSPSKIPNVPTFAEHRYDQAILTCLAIREEIKLHWWADALWYESQRYRWPDDHYPSMFRHHRKRNAGTPGPDPTW